MPSRSARAYADSSVQTSVSAAEPGDLIVLIYERIFDHLKVAKRALENGEYGVEPFTKAHDLIQQGLLAALNPDVGGEVALNLGAIYEWSLREIINARVSKSPEKVDEVINVLSPLYEAWVSLAPKELVVGLAAPNPSMNQTSQASSY
ncbi:flagellar export chaperone FliS [Polynucleobacter sp. MWH-UH23A]|uniref:flagellar export chaperone FliS n=1 Tax=Polynucleobacter sp. MWH-UH23A TaxID=1855613 RepID=UPI003364C4A3